LNRPSRLSLERLEDRYALAGGALDSSSSTATAAYQALLNIAFDCGSLEAGNSVDGTNNIIFRNVPWATIFSPVAASESIPPVPALSFTDMGKTTNTQVDLIYTGLGSYSAPRETFGETNSGGAFDSDHDLPPEAGPATESKPSKGLANANADRKICDACLPLWQDFIRRLNELANTITANFKPTQK
jgi:hypothetical protein